MPNNEVRYLYSVNPKRIIKMLCGVSVIPPIRCSKTLNLTLEEVKELLQYGSVYRRFANENRNERVTILNVERLHNSKFMTEEEYEQYKAELLSKNHGQVVNPDDNKEPDIPSDDKKEEVPEQKHEENNQQSTENQNHQEDKKETTENTNTNNNKYGGKNNKHRN